MSEVWVAGEALIDVFTKGNRQFEIVGGGAANTSKALAGLSIGTSFIGGISNDNYGQLIRSELTSVDLSLSHTSVLPTAVARLLLDDSGSATYEFDLENSASFDFGRDWLPTGIPQMLHVGSLASVIEPGASELFSWAKNISCPITYDPNIRPNVLSDRDEYQDLFRRWAGVSTIVKMSYEDLNWLGSFEPSEILDMGPSLVVVTEGAAGIWGHTIHGSVKVPAERVDVVDTVGAGDTVGAVIIEGFIKYGLEELKGNMLIEVLRRAAHAAGITCSRAGAKPPVLEELA